MTIENIVNIQNGEKTRLRDVLEKIPDLHKDNTRYLLISIIPSESGGVDTDNRDKNLIAYGVDNIPCFVFISLGIFTSALDLQRSNVHEDIVKAIGEKLIGEIKGNFSAIFGKTSEEFFPNNDNHDEVPHVKQ